MSIPSHLPVSERTPLLLEDAPAGSTTTNRRQSHASSQEQNTLPHPNSLPSSWGPRGMIRRVVRGIWGETSPEVTAYLEFIKVRGKDKQYPVFGGEVKSAKNGHLCSGDALVENMLQKVRKYTSGQENGLDSIELDDKTYVHISSGEELADFYEALESLATKDHVVVKESKDSTQLIRQKATVDIRFTYLYEGAKRGNKAFGPNASVSVKEQSSDDGSVKTHSDPYEGMKATRLEIHSNNPQLQKFLRETVEKYPKLQAMAATGFLMHSLGKKPTDGVSLTLSGVLSGGLSTAYEFFMDKLIKPLFPAHHLLPLLISQLPKQASPTRIILGTVLPETLIDSLPPGLIEGLDTLIVLIAAKAIKKEVEWAWLFNKKDFKEKMWPVIQEKIPDATKAALISMGGSVLANLMQYIEFDSPVADVVIVSLFNILQAYSAGGAGPTMERQNLHSIYVAGVEDAVREKRLTVPAGTNLEKFSHKAATTAMNFLPAESILQQSMAWVLGCGAIPFLMGERGIGRISSFKLYDGAMRIIKGTVFQPFEVIVMNILAVLQKAGVPIDTIVDMCPQLGSDTRRLKVLLTRIFDPEPPKKSSSQQELLSEADLNILRPFLAAFGGKVMEYGCAYPTRGIIKLLEPMGAFKGAEKASIVLARMTSNLPKLLQTGEYHPEDSLRDRTLHSASLDGYTLPRLEEEDVGSHPENQQMVPEWLFEQREA